MRGNKRKREGERERERQGMEGEGYTKRYSIENMYNLGVLDRNFRIYQTMPLMQGAHQGRPASKGGSTPRAARLGGVSRGWGWGAGE